MRILLLTAVLCLVGCSTTPRARPEAWVPPPPPSAPKEPPQPIWSATGGSYMELDTERGFTKFAAERVLGHLPDGKTVVIYDQAEEGPINSEVLAERLKSFVRTHWKR